MLIEAYLANGWVENPGVQSAMPIWAPIEYSQDKGLSFVVDTICEHAPRVMLTDYELGYP